MPTPLCRTLGIDVPIIQAPMNWATDAQLVAAVSAAGGLGVIGPNAGAAPPSTDPQVVGERLRSQIRGVRAATDRPFAVNVPIGHGAFRAFSDRSIEVLIEEKVRVAIVVMGSPDVYTARLKEAGVFVIHAVASVKHAQKAERSGVDAVVAEGFDAGGHSGFEELPMAVLAQQVADAVSIPVIAAGGIVNGRGLIIALTTGAQAAYMGTRFMATLECPVHDNVKRTIVGAQDTDTVSWGRKTGIARTFRNTFTEEFRALELSGASKEDLNAFIQNYPGAPGARRQAVFRDGDVVNGELYMGAGAGMITDVPSCADLIRRIIAEARAALSRISGIAANFPPATP